ncbi:PREDICTED: immunoglobulin-like domain-containing receptor 2 [Mandrillus leucophaeus]|uniref:immunoglobulin-like domain-containing receptor 2 n=1 Tax=Mandrillus leucophaeus TaxID=9568 RepID=UPI0005F54F39|nr:PREDICTED: immunoglobulin-like domain-containing receptor 2 [Mandrillus leucophaeus]
MAAGEGREETEADKEEKNSDSFFTENHERKAIVEGLQVTVPDKKKVAMLFQPTVLRCHFSTSSHQPAVVQWKFKSYCQDRMGESLGMSSTRAQSLSKRNLEWDPYLDCLDSRRTVRVVASKQGSTVTLGDFYRGREITIVHDADLQIGKLMWGDSGLYYCIITTPDDLEGKNEDSVELLVLGRTGLLADLLPSFAVEIMPEWVFVGLVLLGVFLFFVLVGICWCQCCPHSCCCYVRCPCCPESCCCPQALYEAGKAAKAGYPPSVSGVPGPYSIPSVPLGGAPSSGMLMDKPHPPPLAPSDSTGGSHSVRKGYRIQTDKERDSMKVLYYVEKELAQFDPARRMRGRYNNTISELSSLHEEDSNFRQSFRQMRSKQFPVSGDLESNPDYWSGVMGGSSGASRGPSAMEYNKEDRESFRHSQPRSKSEMLSRKNFATGVPAVSMDELAAFADSYGQRPRRWSYIDFIIFKMPRAAYSVPQPQNGSPRPQRNVGGQSQMSVVGMTFQPGCPLWSDVVNISLDDKKSDMDYGDKTQIQESADPGPSLAITLEDLLISALGPFQFLKYPWDWNLDIPDSSSSSQPDIREVSKRNYRFIWIQNSGQKLLNNKNLASSLRFKIIEFNTGIRQNIENVLANLEQQILEWGDSIY